MSDSRALAPSTALSHKPRARYQSLSGVRFREALWAYAFITPTFVGFFTFIAGPMVFSLGMSLFEWDIVSAPTFIGVENYRFMLSDDRFGNAFRNTALFAGLVVGLNLVVALSLAVALQRTLPT